MIADIGPSTTGSRRLWRNLMGLAIACGTLLGATALQADSFQPPLETPAPHNSLATVSPLLDVVASGERIVAVGLHGNVVFSDDVGETWEQAEVPVSTDLVAMSFVGESKGWAVGHGGVVLHTEDGGASWNKQLDGFQAVSLAIDYYEANQGGLEDELTEEMLFRERSFVMERETQPFMDVLFLDELHGYVVGTFNRIFTTSDGGKSWKPLMHLTDNPGELHFYAISGNDEAIYLAGEQGKVWRLDPQIERFVSADTPYAGTLFGVLPFADGSVLAYGMRGSVYLSRDQGDSWRHINTQVSGGVTTALALPDGRLLIADQSGKVSQSLDGGSSFSPLQLSRPMPYFGAAWIAEGRIALVGIRGVRIEMI